MIRSNVQDDDSQGFDDLLSPGSLFAEKYRILTVLGHGGMGVVYKAEHLFMERIVALKTVLTSFAASSTAAIRFKQEAKAASSLSHQNIVAVHDFGIADNCAYLVMDYLEGRTLTNDILSFERFVHIFRQACDALDHAHQHGIIHRDLKCGNLMLVQHEKDRDFLKLVDFGLAKVISPTPGQEQQSLTTTGMIVGSPLYMSPEQCRGRELDARSDIYSLGCVMYEALTGEPPLMGETALDTMCLHLNESPRSMIKINSAIDPRLDRLVMRMLKKDPDQRPASMALVRRELNISPQPVVRHLSVVNGVKPAVGTIISVAPQAVKQSSGRRNESISRFAVRPVSADAGSQIWQSVVLSLLLIGAGVVGALAFFGPGLNRQPVVVQHLPSTAAAGAPVKVDQAVELTSKPPARALPLDTAKMAHFNQPKVAAKPVSVPRIVPVDPYTAYDLPRPVLIPAATVSSPVSPSDFANVGTGNQSERPLRRIFAQRAAQYSGSRLGSYNSDERPRWRTGIAASGQSQSTDSSAGNNGGTESSSLLNKARETIANAHSGQIPAAKEGYESLRSSIRSDLGIFGRKPQLFEELACIAKHCGHYDEAQALHNRACQLQQRY